MTDYIAAGIAALESSIADPKADYNKADEAFIQDMIPHHQAAIDMAATVLAKGKNKDVLALARGVKAAQGAEIKKMRQWLKDRNLKEGSEKRGMN